MLLAASPLCAQQNGAGAIQLHDVSEIEFKEAALMLRNQAGIENVIPRIAKNPDIKAILYFSYTSENSRITAMQALMTAGYQPVIAGTNIPADFPQPGSATSKAERIHFAEAKANWIANNPDLYEQMQAPVVTVISQAEFDSMPQAKQQHVLDNPDLYTIE
jgi:hypothetical protein